MNNIPCRPPIGLTAEVTAYLDGLKPDERVMECGVSCLTGREGTVYLSENGGGLCILWDKHEGEEGQMGTSVTWGARRLCDANI